MKLKYMIVAQGVVRDKVSNLISIFNIYEELTAKSFPIAIQRMGVAAFFDRSKGDPGKAKIIFELKLGRELLMSRNITISFEKLMKNRTLINIDGLIVNSPGNLIFLFRDKDRKLLNSYTIKVLEDSKPQFQRG